MPADSSQQIGQSVGARLRAARLAKKYTQNQLARPDFSVSYISAIERGQIQPSLRALEILAQRLELSTTDLLPVHSAFIGASASEVAVAALGSEEWDLLLLEAQIAIYQKNPERAIVVLQGFLPQKGERRQEHSSTIYYVLGRAYLEAGRLEESEQVLAEAARLSREGFDPLYPCILSLQSVVYTTMHNTEQAAQLQRESLRFLASQPESTQNMVFLAQLHANLAHHHHHQGEFEQASEQFQKALQFLSFHHASQKNQENYRQLLTEYAAKEFYSLATLYGYKWLIADFRCQLPGVRSAITYALGRILLRSNLEEARSYLLEVVQEARASQDRLLLAGAHVQLASWSMAHGELSQAEQWLSLVLEQSASFGETLVDADAQLLAGELAYKQQDYLRGDRCFETGLALFEKVGAREDLTEHLARYAQLLEGRNCITQSLFYWKLAFEQRKKNYLPVL